MRTTLSALLTTCTILTAVQDVAAQTDPHFTQNYTFPLYINPALTGSSDGSYRASAIYRSAWGSLGNPYRTTGFSFDASTDKNIAVGVNVLNQSAEDGGFNYLTAHASVAYTGVKFGKDENHRMVFAMQGGIIDRRVDQSNFKWGEQWNPVTGYNASNPTSESFAANAATSLDLGAGVLYYDASPDKKANIFGGLSFFHINRPKDPIISSQTATPNVIPIRYTLHGGASFRISDVASVVPHALVVKQGNAAEAMAGVYMQRNINEETDLMVGGYYRYKDALAPFVGVGYKDFLIGVSYDANTSKLGNMARNVNSFELSFSYTKRKESKSLLEFIRCPRL